MCCPCFCVPAVGVLIRSRPRGRPARRICLAAPKGAVRHVRRSSDLSSLTSFAAHSRASVIFPASLKARAFAKAWLSDRRSAADSFPGRALCALRSASDVLRIAADPTRFRRATNLDRQRLDRNVYPCQAAGSDRPPRRHAFVEPKFGFTR
jgi:hypothetical protein